MNTQRPCQQDVSSDMYTDMIGERQKEGETRKMLERSYPMPDLRAISWPLTPVPLAPPLHVPIIPHVRYLNLPTHISKR